MSNPEVVPWYPYSLTQDVFNDLEKRFAYHKPHSMSQTDRYAMVRDAALDLAKRATRMCPPSRELSVAYTKLEEFMFWANAAIARNEKEQK